MIFKHHKKSQKSNKKFFKNCQKWFILASFWKPEAYGQTVLLERSVLIRQKLVENAKIKKLKCYILSNFQKMCSVTFVSVFDRFYLIFTPFVSLLINIFSIIHEICFPHVLMHNNVVGHVARPQRLSSQSSSFSSATCRVTTMAAFAGKLID